MLTTCLKRCSTAWKLSMMLIAPSSALTTMLLDLQGTRQHHESQVGVS